VLVERFLEDRLRQAEWMESLAQPVLQIPALGFGAVAPGQVAGVIPVDLPGSVPAA